MFYVVQFKSDETIVRGAHVGSDSADVHCDYLSERWPNAYFDVLSEHELDTEPCVKC
jgi:hypothetical protein